MSKFKLSGAQNTQISFIKEYTVFISRWCIQINGRFKLDFRPAPFIMLMIQVLMFSRIVHLSTIEFINETFILGRRYTIISAVLLANLRGVLAYSQNLFTILFCVHPERHMNTLYDII